MTDALPPRRPSRYTGKLFAAAGSIVATGTPRSPSAYTGDLSQSSRSSRGSSKMRPGDGIIQYSAPIGRVGLPGAHWTENPAAMEVMQQMHFTYEIPALQPRLTAFHGTRVPVLVLYFLLSTEVGSLAVLDTFWKRIVKHPMVWQGLYCRDYGTKRCVWRTLEGAAGSEKCLCHLGTTHPDDFIRVCKKITAIPGRSKEELLETYCKWRDEQNALMAAARGRAVSKDASEVAGSEQDTDGGVKASTSAALPRQIRHSTDVIAAAMEKPWQVRAHALYGLKTSHGLNIADRLDKPLAPALPASAGRRELPIGRPPKRGLLKASPRC